ncbi:MAG: site-specific DNA-methyltransferase [Armatimonadetes bacterium]|nr:site-specific DNA-methyltransferase [Armatimonadota bacterium]
MHKILKRDSRFIDQEGDLLKSEVIDKAWKSDRKLIELLLEDEKVKAKFFAEIKGHWVFNIHTFIDYIQDKNFLNDSYTKYKNKVGLNIAGKFLKEREEVALVWPFKDCILEGGMTREDEKRKEIFFNEILAQDEIDRLLDPKVLTNWKRYTSNGIKEIKNLKRDEQGTIRENLIIKGNNLLTLHSLKTQFQGKIKLIYIDPPYNTGNDSFGYNDNFNHSTWLTFMKNRLEVARELLRDDGVIFVQCDDNEQAYLKVLMDEVFCRENFIEVITVVNNPRGRDYGGIANMHELICVYSKSINYQLYRIVDENKKFPYYDKISGFEIRELRNRNIKFNLNNRPNLFYQFYLNPDNQDKNGFFEISLDYKEGWNEIYPVKSQGIQTVWRWGKDKSKSNLNVNICGKKTKNKSYQIVEKYREKSRMARSVWWDKEVNSERGTLHLKKIFGEKIFAHPKPEETLKRIIEISTKENDIILDFFVGSGTTCAVAHKMKRQYIGIEQMDYVENITVERLKKVIGRKIKKEGSLFAEIEYDRSGISKAVNWQGGGDFVYCELKKYNEEFIEQIQEAKTTAELLKTWEEMKDKSFLNWNVDIKRQDEAMEEFKELAIAKQKKVLVMLLNKNQIYVNLSEIDDEDFQVNEEDKKMNREFYNF